MDSIEQRLSGGHPNSLGNTISVVQLVLKDPARLPELYNCYFSDDEVVRMRVSNAMKRICRERKELLLPYMDHFLDDISQINQASTQWTLAQLYQMLEVDMSPSQLQKARKQLLYNLEHHRDWIVLNMTMDTLARWALEDEELKNAILADLNRLRADSRKSVASKADKMLALLT